MSVKNLYINDLIHRYASHTFDETTTGSLINVQFKDSGSVTVGESTKLVDIDAYRAIRGNLLTGENPLFRSTTTQRNALTGIDSGTLIDNITTGLIERYNGTAWGSVAGTGTMKPVAFGEMVEDNSSGSSINTTSKLWDTASAGDLDANGLITFVNGANEDYLLVGTGGAGTYQVHFSCSFTNAGGNFTNAGIHKNGSEVGKMEDSHDGDSSEIRDLRGQGFLVLADADQIKMHVVSSTPSDVVTVYHCHITMKRMT